jgi:hypothetical protein
MCWRDALEWGVALARTLAKKGKTPSALAFRGPSVDSLYMVELKLDVN